MPIQLRSLITGLVCMCVMGCEQPWREAPGQATSATASTYAITDALAMAEATTAAGSSAAPTALRSARVDQSPPAMLNGIAIDEEGVVWIADMLDSQLIGVEMPSGRIVARYGREVGVDGPDDLVVDRDFIYYTAAATLFGATAKLDRNTGRATTIAPTGIGTNPIAWGPHGKLLVGLSPAASAEVGVALGLNGLFEVDPERGTYKLIVEDDKGVNAFCMAPDGYLYGPHGLWGTAVLRINIDSGEVTTVHETKLASAVRYNPLDDHLYALAGESETRATLLRMALDGSDFSVFARMSELPDSIGTSADNFAIAPDGTFYVTRFLYPIITRISADGSQVEDLYVGDAN